MGDVDGTHARPGELRLPGLRPRLLATLIDLAVAAVLGVGTVALLGDGPPVEVQVGILLFATAVPSVLVEVGTGRSLGKAALQLHHVRPGEPRPDLMTFVVRWGLKWLVPTMLVVLVFVPWTWAVLLWMVDGLPLLRSDRRALHDLVAGTRVWELVTRER